MSPEVVRKVSETSSSLILQENPDVERAKEIIAKPIVWIYDLAVRCISRVRDAISWCQAHPDRALVAVGLFVVIGGLAMWWGNVVERWRERDAKEAARKKNSKGE